MFGYVTPFKPDLKVREYETYKSVYCGLCKEMGRVFGPFARLTLNYDFAFMAMLELAVNDRLPEFESCRCAVNPFKKKTCAKKCGELEFSASVAMIMLYYKVKDNIRDSKGPKKLLWLFLLPFAGPAHRKATRLYPDAEKSISDAMGKQYSIETVGTSGIDESADPTASALAAICGMMNEKKKKELEKFGYLLGRWVYLVDAFDDIEDDVKTGSYNPFVNACGDTPGRIKEYATGSLNVTAAELQLALEALDITVFKPIIYNVVYLGLKDTQNRIMNKKESKGG